MDIKEVITAFRSPWQSPYVERFIGSIRRECLDHVVVLTELSLRRYMVSCLDYYHGSRSHLSLANDRHGAQRTAILIVLILRNVGVLRAAPIVFQAPQSFPATVARFRTCGSRVHL